MKKLLFSFDYKEVIEHLLTFLGYVVLCFIKKDIVLFPCALLVSSLFCTKRVFFSSFLFILSFIVTNNFGMIPALSIPAVLLPFIHKLYKNKKPRYEMCLYLLVTLIPFIFLGNTLKETDVIERIISIVFAVMFSFILSLAEKSIIYKGIKFKYSYIEYLSILISISVFGFSLCKFLSPLVWKAICIFMILVLSFFCKKGITTLFSSFLGISLSIYYGNLTYLSLFTVMGVSAELFSDLSRYISATAVVLSEYIICTVFTTYFSYGLADLFSSIIASFIFSLIPSKLLLYVKSNLDGFREKQLYRYSINRNRRLEGDRLYELSTVFEEMSFCFKSFNKIPPSDISAKKRILSEISSNVCLSCESRNKCKGQTALFKNELNRLLDIGLAKGKISLIDISANFLDCCIKPNNIIFCTNKLLSEHKFSIIETMNMNSGKSLLADEAEGVSDVLKSLALESSTTLNYQSKLESILTQNLFKGGFPVSELLIYGEGENLTISLVISLKDYSIDDITKIIVKTVGINVSLFEQNEIVNGKYYLGFRKSADYDAVLGVFNVKKDNSEISGDTHSCVRIRDNKFMVALSDGMGSGKLANEISSTSVSLIESFYKAGLSSDLILKTVNKMLTVSTEDTFSALDIMVIDLKNCNTDFIKYGSPYGFIIGKDDIKIIEGSSLPLGIINELKPTSSSTVLCEGDIVLLLSDGVSDAFGSSSEIISFLQNTPCFNPQTLSEKIIHKALEFTGGVKNDDMTALAVRVFKKNDPS